MACACCGSVTSAPALALADATTAVEEVADGFETDGLRERAFDCYQLIARLGSEAGAFENVAEGYLNSVRILRDDGLKLDALRLHEAFVTMARRAGEWHAAAGILREAADYCTRSAHALRRRPPAAQRRGLAEGRDRGARRRAIPLQIVENAYLAAAEAFASVRAFKQVLEVYRRLLQLELSGRARERYRRLCDRLTDDLHDAPRPVPVPEFLKQLPEYEEVWYVDLAEWELDGDPALVAAGVMADRRFPDFVRRHALLLVLELERRAAAVPPVDVVRRLESIRAYPVIAALEALFEARDSAIRRAVAEAMGARLQAQLRADRQGAARRRPRASARPPRGPTTRWSSPTRSSRCGGSSPRATCPMPSARGRARSRRSARSTPSRPSSSSAIACAKATASTSSSPRTHSATSPTPSCCRICATRSSWCPPRTVPSSRTPRGGWSEG